MNWRLSVNGFNTRRFAPGVTSVAMALCAAVMASPRLCAAAQHDESRTFPYEAVIIETKALIRAGGGDAYYPFGELKAGDVVTVAQERFNWARILTRGPAFDTLFGYVQAKDVQRAADGATGIALGRVAVLAPNLASGFSPESSWRPIGEIAAERTVSILGVVETEPGSYYRIALPESCEGWIPLRFLRPATQQEVLAWQQRQATAAVQTPTQPPQGPETASVERPVTPLGGSADPPVAVQPSGPPQATPPAGTANEPLAIAADEIHNVDLQSPLRPASQPAQREATPISPIEPLEQAYEAIKSVPIREAEISELLERYRAILATGQLEHREEVIAKARIELLSARRELQEQMRSLDQVRNRASMSAETVEAARLQIELAAVYAAVGLVNPSTIYDGKRLPLFFRLTDPATGRTIAYLAPSDRFDYLNMVGHLVGIVGEKSYDPGMRLNLITATRVDLLTVVDRSVR